VAAAYQGVPGAYSEHAARLFVGDAATMLPCASLEAVVAAVVDRRVTSGVVPIENSLAGAVPGAVDLLSTYPVCATGERVLPIRHALIGVPGASLDDVRRVHSHPMALAQCRRLFARYPHLEAVPAFDTAGAVADVLGRGDRREAAIAGRRAAMLYGGEVLHDDVADRRDNATRFLLITASEAQVLPALRAGWKTTVLCVWANTPGALVRGLLPLVSRGLNLSRIESRPVGEVPFEYQFLLDIDPASDAVVLAEALAALKRETRAFRVVGHYPRSATSEVADRAVRGDA
jgi:prephenate dehydratase